MKKRGVRVGSAVTTSEAGCLNLYNTSVPLQNKKKNISGWRDWLREMSSEIKQADGTCCPEIKLRILVREEAQEI